MYQSNINKYLKNIKTRRTQMAKIEQIILLVILSLLSMNFVARVFYLAFILFVVIAILQKGLDIPGAVFPTFLLAISMCMFSPSAHDEILGMIKPFTYPLCVIIGYNLAYADNVEKTKKQVIWIIIALAFGSYSHYILNMFYNWGQNIGRNTFDIWTRTILSATGQASLACIMIGVSITLLFSELHYIIKISSFIVLISILYYNLILAGRTIFILVTIILILNFLISFMRIRSTNTLIKRMLIIFLILFIIYYIIKNNIFGINDIFRDSNYFKRFYSKYGSDGIYEDGRLLFKKMYLQNMLYYPFGGNELRQAVGNHHAHDVLLDTYSDSGLFAMIAVMIMIINTIVRVYKICKYDRAFFFFNMIISNVIIAILYIFSIEPILEGMPWLFASFCVIYGAIAQLIDNLNNRDITMTT